MQPNLKHTYTHTYKASLLFHLPSFTPPLPSQRYIIRSSSLCPSLSNRVTRSLPSLKSVAPLTLSTPTLITLANNSVFPCAFMHGHTLSQSMSTAEYAAIDFSLVSWQTRAHSVAFKQQEAGMISVHIKLLQSLPLDHLRIV